MQNPFQKRAQYLLFSLTFCILVVFAPRVSLCQQTRNALAPPRVQKLTLADSAMCEEVREHKPWNRSEVFSVSLGQVFCFTSFDPVPKSTYIFHKWFLKEKIIAQVKLYLNSPRWSTFSKMHLRPGDKGPWHVEISNGEGKTLGVLRFSVVE